MDEHGFSAAILKAAREKLGTVTPLKRDCGSLCGAACCKTDEDGRGGMLLFPGEEEFYRALPDGFSLAEDSSLVPGAKLFTCLGLCARDVRPLACRVFPLMFIRKGTEYSVKLDPRAWPLCPLMPSGLEGLSVDFVSAAQEAASILAQDETQRAFIFAQQRAVARLTQAPWEGGGEA